MALTRYLTITLTAIFALTTPLAIASPKSVILIIGDGFDDQHVTMGRNYLEGQSGQLLLDTMPVRAAMQVETVDADGNRLYVADSANTATSIATGTITQIGRIGVDAEDQDQETVLESAAKAGCGQDWSQPHRSPMPRQQRLQRMSQSGVVKIQYRYLVPKNTVCNPWLPSGCQDQRRSWVNSRAVSGRPCRCGARWWSATLRDR